MSLPSPYSSAKRERDMPRLKPSLSGGCVTEGVFEIAPGVGAGGAGSAIPAEPPPLRDGVTPASAGRGYKSPSGSSWVTKELSAGGPRPGGSCWKVQGDRRSWQCTQLSSPLLVTQRVFLLRHASHGRSLRLGRLRRPEL